ncbi:hypothetical protein, unknown function [Leishmania donovani]|uniref:Uncharacterized protein n=1 Tax=Leishmania donovani TaxID=5661 RepID=E9BSU7_LEIDO|nr:hypothetical protein, unknown function [Leishmania donovani]CBZ38326.1 hypothetical protein, unknown function [Leishmania donovani]
MAHCISRPTYGRHVKVLMLLLGELRFRILIRDARFFAEHHQSAPSLSRMRGESSAAQLAEQRALTRAFQLRDWHRYHDAAHMQMRRNALGKGKASEFAKELSLAYKQVMQATEHIGKKRRALTTRMDCSVKTREWAAAGHDIAGALEKFGAASYWESSGTGFLVAFSSLRLHTRALLAAPKCCTYVAVCAATQISRLPNTSQNRRN